MIAEDQWLADMTEHMSYEDITHELGEDIAQTTVDWDEMIMQYPEWTEIDWDGNPALKLKCWRKSFRNGNVSVGIGDFHLICYSYGANSDFSMSSTRSRMLAYGTPDLTEKQAMDMVDKNKGYALSRDVPKW